MSDDEPSDAEAAAADDGVPGGDAAPQRSRVRIGVGAAVVLVLVALVCAVVISLVTPHGRTDTIALAAATSGRVASSGGAAVPASVSGASSEGGPTGTSSTTASPSPTSATDGAGTRPGATAGAGATTAGAAQTGAAIMVHVLGSVVRPGLYQLKAGDRVFDAVAAAGGFSANADQGQQNLARVVKDGEQLVIPETGVAPPLGSVAAAAGAGAAGAAGAGGSGSPGASSGSGGASSATPAIVNINTADETTLETLPHVGPQVGARIIAWRTANGPFTQVEDLKNVSGIGDKTFAELQPLVTV
ncbi:hypothetical protein GCM10011399_36710 [Subtercola lobariae]|uniref:Soluble ligand binding domain-containing protein n=2 Tax=Subtercola lobariae TaxID=1588641 RepID=A0A917BEQ8_9MICO|nr:hypothetical protein GCM10011399_36710 [Subtercola lobariae]